MAPKKTPRRSTAPSSALPSAATSQAPVTPSRRPNRPAAILTTPRTPSGPWLPNTSSSSISGSGSGPSSTRSGRSYLPADTGIPAGLGSRPRNSTVRPQGSPGSPSWRTCGLASLAKNCHIPIEDLPVQANSPAPDRDPDRVSASLSPSTQPQEEEEDVQTVSGAVSCNNEEQQTMTPTTKPFNGTEDDTLPIDILPDDSSSATTTTIPTRQTAMEGEMQWFLSLPHEERHAIHLANPFAIPNDMNEWVNDNLRTRPPSPPSHTQTGNRARWSPPPQAQHESFFEDLYERTMDARKSATSSHPEESAEESRAAPEPAMITAPFPPGIPVPPRVPSIFPLATSEIEPTMYEKVMRQPPSRTTTPQPQNYCIQPDCPIAPLRHPQGRYLHNDRLAPNHLPTFSTSNPPPHIWQAIHNGTLGIGTQHDANIISKFLAYHVRFCNFSVVPDTNFIWGHEIHSRGMDVVRRPFVRLPFPVTPLRVRFDAGPNLDGDGREGGGEGEGMEGVLFDGVVDEDDDGRREVVRRRILAL